MDLLFGRRKTPEELLRQNQRALNRAMRELDRERQKLENQEKQKQSTCCRGPGSVLVSARWFLTVCNSTSKTSCASLDTASMWCTHVGKPLLHKRLFVCVFERESLCIGLMVLELTK